MTPDPEKVKEALDNRQYRGDLPGDHALYTVDVTVLEAARSWLSGTDIRWCETHGERAHPQWPDSEACYNQAACRIVTRRLSEGTE